MAVPDSPSASTLFGLWFVFKQDGHTIALHASGLTAKEEVYVDGLLVAQRRRVSLKGTHVVTAGGKEYVLHVTARNAALGLVECALLHDGKVVAGQRSNYESNVPPGTHAVTVCATALAIYVTYKFSATQWWATAALLCLAAACMGWSIYRARYTIQPMPAAAIGEA